MGLFSKKEKKQTSDRKSIFDSDYPIDKSSWYQVFSACLGKMMVIQNACSEQVVRGRDWNVDFSAGVISFGGDEYPLQFIGSEAASDNTWLWGWENINGFDGRIITLAESTKRLGELWGLEPLTTAEFELDETFNGHNLAIIACGISREEFCYYRGPHSGGAILVAFSGVPSQVFSPIDGKEFTHLTMQCIQKFHIDHKIFAESLLLWNGTEYEWEGNCIKAHFDRDLNIEFEQAGECWRISSVKTILG